MVGHTLLTAYPGPGGRRMLKRLPTVRAVAVCTDPGNLFSPVLLPLCRGWQHSTQPAPRRVAQGLGSEEDRGRWSSEQRCGNTMYGKCAGTGQKCSMEVCWLNTFPRARAACTTVPCRASASLQLLSTVYAWPGSRAAEKNS